LNRLCLHHWVDETPADGGIVDGGIAGECRLRLGHDEGRATHALHATRDDEICFAGLDGASSGDYGVHAGAAETVDGGPRHRTRQTGQKQRHARDIAVVLAGLVGAAEDDVVDGFPVDSPVPLDEGLEGNGAKIVGAHRRQRTTETADRRADVVADEGFRHGICS